MPATRKACINKVMTSPVVSAPAPLNLTPAQRALLDERLGRARQIVAKWAQNGGRRPSRAVASASPFAASQAQRRERRIALEVGFKTDDPGATKRALVEVLERSLTGAASDAAVPAVSGATAPSGARARTGKASVMAVQARA